MTAEHDMHAGGEEADAETRLAHNREVLRRRLAQVRADERSGVSGALDELASASLPIARQTVRRHPYTSLIGAALAGVLVVRWKPWRHLGRSVLIGWLSRQALSAPARGRGFNWLMAAARAKRKSAPPL